MMPEMLANSLVTAKVWVETTTVSFPRISAANTDGDSQHPTNYHAQPPRIL